MARSAGFEHFALTMTDHIAKWEGGAWVERGGIRWLVCPEHRGKLPDCNSCRYCWMGKGPVAFLDHTYTTRKGEIANVKKRD